MQIQVTKPGVEAPGGVPLLTYLDDSVELAVAIVTSPSLVPDEYKMVTAQ